jgi:Tat protein secretion system quality control protein TatD with DNase activity
MVHTAGKVAEVRNVPLDVIARITTANAARLFGLPLPSEMDW